MGVSKDSGALKRSAAQLFHGRRNDEDHSCWSDFRLRIGPDHLRSDSSFERGKEQSAEQNRPVAISVVTNGTFGEKRNKAEFIRPGGDNYRGLSDGMPNITGFGF